MTKQGRGTDQEVYNGGAVAALDASGGDVAVAAAALLAEQDNKIERLVSMVTDDHDLVMKALEDAMWNIDDAGMLLLDPAGAES